MYVEYGIMLALVIFIACGWFSRRPQKKRPTPVVTPEPVQGEQKNDERFTANPPALDNATETKRPTSVVTPEPVQDEQKNDERFTSEPPTLENAPELLADPNILSTEYENPFDDRFVLILGQFNAFSAESLENLLEQAGAIVADGLGSHVGIVLAGDRPGEVYDEAVLRNFEIWDEARLLQALTGFNDHLSQQMSAFQFNPIESAVRPYLVHGEHIDSVLGMPIARDVFEEVQGEQFSYMIRGDAFNPTWQYSNMQSLQALVLFELSREQMQIVIDHALHFPQLKALVLIDCNDYFVRCDQLLHALPLLTCLYAFNSKLEFGVVRHHSLQQLHLDSTYIDHFSAVSFPELRYLHFSANMLHENNVQIEPVLAMGAFPKLIHLGIEEYRDPVAYLKTLSMLPAIQSVALAAELLVIHGSLDEVQAAKTVFDSLADWAGIKDLTHLHLVGSRFFFADILIQENFPQLSHLEVTAVHKETVEMMSAETPEAFEELQRLTFWPGLNLKISEPFTDAYQWLSLHQVLSAKPPLASLDLRGSRFMLDREAAIFDTLPYPVYCDPRF